MKRFSKFVKESIELDEAVEVSHDRYMRSHGKKASGGEGNWMFTHKSMGDANVNDPKEVHSARGKFSDAKKSAQQWAKKHGHSTVYVMEELEQIDEISDEKKKEYIRAVADKGGIFRKPRPGSLAGFDRRKEKALVKAFKGGSMQDYVKLHKKSEKRAGIAHKALDSLKKEEVELGENIAGRFKDASEWERSAKARGLVVKPATHPSGEMTKYQIAKDKQGNNRGHFDHGTKTGQIHEVSDKKLDAYRQKAFADQPSGDDGSDKYRKRKFGRDLAFAKQTGRAKVLATKEEVELDEASNLRITKVYNPKKATYAVHSPDRKYYKEFDTEAEAKAHKASKNEEYFPIEEALNVIIAEGVDIDDLTEAQLDELIGTVARAIGRGIKKTVINKQGNFRFSTAGRADAAEAQAKKLEKARRDRERLQKARERIQKERERARNRAGAT